MEEKMLDTLITTLGLNCEERECVKATEDTEEV